MFKLKSPYVPAGDQPLAIQNLVNGLKNGAQHQTVLGVTGSGKSVVGSTKVLVYSAGRYYHAAIHHLDEVFSDLPKSTEVTQYLPLKNKIQTLALNVENGSVSMEEVQEISRHRYDGDIYHIETSDGRSNSFTDSHNVFALRDGILGLFKSEELKIGDYVPAPLATIPAPTQSLVSFDLTEWLPGDMFVTLGDVSALSPQILPSAKISAIKRGEALRINEYRRIKEIAPSINTMTAGSKHRKARLPANIPVSYKIMRLLGLYIAEGCNVKRGVIISSGDQSIVSEVVDASSDLGLIVKKIKNQTYDYMLPGKTLATILDIWCGSGARNKHLPLFWPQLGNDMLAGMLSGVFAGDGCVEKNAVTLSSVSYELLSDVQVALCRFGIMSRILKKKTKYKGTIRHSWVLSVSGQKNIKTFHQCVGFGLARKDLLLSSLAERKIKTNTNVDLMPLPTNIFSDLMKKYNILQKDLAKVAGVKRSLISMYLSLQRKPSRLRAQKIAEYLLNLVKDHKDEPALDFLSNYIGLANLFWTPIKSIEKEKVNTVVYDLSVPKLQTFLANGFFVHNTFTIANVIAEINRPTMVMAPNKTLAAQLYMEFKEFFPDNAVEYFVSYYDYYQPEAYVPSSDTFIDKDAQINEQIEQLRLSATKSLLERRDVIVVSSVSAIYGLGDPGEFKKMSVFVSQGLSFKQKDFLKRLAELQYTRNDVVLERGTFRVRGDVVDVWPGDLDHFAVRLEFFDDEIEKISILDPLTGKKTNDIQRYTLYPKSHYVTSRERVLTAIGTIKEELCDRMEEFYAANKLVEAQRLKDRVFYDLELFKEIGYCNGVENYSRHLSGAAPGSPPPTLFDYMPKDGLLVIDESHVTVPQIGGMFFGDRSRKENLVDYGFRLPSALDNRPLAFEEWERKKIQRIYVSATPGPYEKEHNDQTVELVVRPTGLLDPVVEVRPQVSQVDDLLGEVKKVIARNERVLVTTLTKKMAEDLADYLAENDVKVRYLHSDIDTVERMAILRDLRLGTFDVLVGINLLREGLDLPEVSLVAILDADKEGFLRSTSSLIQTIGRAARNQNGKAILYATNVTRSMKDAMDETARRREKQIEFNKTNKITPKTVERKINAEFSVGQKKGKDKGKGGNKKGTKDIDLFAKFNLDKMPKGKEDDVLLKMEAEMKKLAEDLNFEDALTLREKIKEVKKSLGLPEGL